MKKLEIIKIINYLYINIIQYNKYNKMNNNNLILELMANMINYLNVSLYKNKVFIIIKRQFTYNHEQARLRLNEIYDILSKTPSITPSKNDILDFYNNVKYLKNVTDTDDIDYWNYISKLKQYIITYKS